MCLWSHLYMPGRSCCLDTPRLFQPLAYKAQHLLILTQLCECYVTVICKISITTTGVQPYLQVPVPYIYTLSKPGHHCACNCRCSADQNLGNSAMKSLLISMISCNLLWINDIVPMVKKIKIVAFRMLTQSRHNSTSQAMAIWIRFFCTSPLAYGLARSDV